MASRHLLSEVPMLEALRQDKGVGLRELVEQTGLSHRTILRYERGETNRPHAASLETLARFYGVRASVLLNDIRRVYRETHPEEEDDRAAA
jgi:transcriptional regulator with XRE-family HTH domain